MKGSRSAALTPANARTTGKPSPSKPRGPVVTDLTGNQRIGISPLIVMFLLAIFLLNWVNKNGEAEQ